ncbi:MAG: hypothetical protein ACOVSV_01555 [Fimbriimonadaceae bacterium]
MNERVTMRPLLVLLPVAVAITTGCGKQETFALPLESDPFFLGSQRQVVRPFGDPWIMHYFSSESPDGVISRLENATFFKALAFQRIRRLENGTFSASMRKASSTDGSDYEKVSSIFVFPGEQSADLKSVLDPAGATVVILPKK